jgi:uncharacterized protein (DUF1330 family)
MVRPHWQANERGGCDESSLRSCAVYAHGYRGRCCCRPRASCPIQVYLINEIDVTDPEKYGAEFTPKAQASVRNSGAKFLVIGGAAGAGAKPIHAIEGTPPKRITIQVWDSVDALKKWYDSPEYQDALKIGHKYATFRRYAVEGQ